MVALVRTYALAAWAALAVFTVGAVALAITLPYHDWDSFAFGSWSRSLAAGKDLDPLSPGAQEAARPLFYVLQGALWAVTGVSFSAGRLLSLAFALLAVAGCALFVREAVRGRERLALAAALAPILLIAIPSFTQEAIAGKSDVPAAAMVALCGYLALRTVRSDRATLGLAVAVLLAVLTKPTVLMPLLFLGCVLIVEARRLRRDILALAVGGVIGVAYLEVMAARFHTWLVPFLKTGTDGLWGQRAAAERLDAFLSLDVLGGALRLPLAFALVYAVARLGGLRHRLAAAGALLLGTLWAVAGPAAASGFSVFEGSWQGFALIGFAALLLLGVFADEADVAERRHLLLGLAVGVPPLALWLYATAYAARLASTAWPGLVLLIAVSLTPGIAVLRRLGWSAALVPLTVLAAAFWFSLGTLDGLHGPDWVAYRQLGWSGAWDDERTTNIVLPSLQTALATATPHLGRDGRISVSDPTFSWFLPGRIDQTTALRCEDVAHDRVFILLTSDESEEAAREAGGLATPEQWAACRSPKLTELSDGSNDGYAVFTIG